MLGLRRSNNEKLKLPISFLCQECCVSIAVVFMKIQKQNKRNNFVYFEKISSLTCLERLIVISNTEDFPPLGAFATWHLWNTRPHQWQYERRHLPNTCIWLGRRRRRSTSSSKHCWSLIMTAWYMTVEMVMVVVTTVKLVNL